MKIIKLIMNTGYFLYNKEKKRKTRKTKMRWIFVGNLRYDAPGETIIRCGKNLNIQEETRHERFDVFNFSTFRPYDAGLYSRSHLAD
jgi:hypothetical protein